MPPSTLRFIGTNYALNAATTILAVTSEDANFPGVNVKVRDRYIVWKSTSTSGVDINLDLDIGTGKTVAVVGVLGFRPAGVNISPTTVNVLSGTTYPGGLTNVVSISTILKRDMHALVTPSGNRYWRFSFSLSTNQFSVGKVLLGTIDDLGIAYSPGSAEAPGRTRSRVVTVMGAPVIRDQGDVMNRLRYQFRSVPQATRDKLITYLNLSAMPKALLTPFDQPIEFIPDQDFQTVEHAWGPPDLYNLDFQVMALP